MNSSFAVVLLGCHSWMFFSGCAAGLAVIITPHSRPFISPNQMGCLGPVAVISALITVLIRNWKKKEKKHIQSKVGIPRKIRSDQV